MTPVSARTGEDSPLAVRHASWMLCLAGLMEVPALLDDTARWALHVVVAVGFFAVAVTLRLLTRQRADHLGQGAFACLVVLLFAGMGTSTWAAGSQAIVTAPGYVLIFLWLGLHAPPRVIAGSVVLGLVVHMGALHLAGTPTQLIASALFLLPISGLVGLVVARSAAENRRAQAVIAAEERWRAATMLTLAHDVRSPLTSIVGALELLEDDPSTDEGTRRLVQGASRQAARIMRLATGLLDLERVGQGRLVLDRRDWVLGDLVREIVSTMPDVPVVVAVPSDLVVWADRERVEQVLVNLANNCARHGAPPIAIGAEADAGGVRISVRDHGSGVPPENAGHLFEQFRSGDSAPQAVGLGLWIARLLTEAHDGSIRYEQADPGARFVVTLPSRDAVEAREESRGQTRRAPQVSA